jgi:hypothetical protein
MSPGQTLMFTVQAVDFAGNKATVTTPPLTIDITPPVISELTCTPYLSRARSELSCSWETTVDGERPLNRVIIGEEYIELGGHFTELWSSFFCTKYTS